MALKNIDYYFFYKYSVRTLLMYKIPFIKNTYNIPKIIRISLSFSLRKLEEIDTAEAYNYLYLFKFFFGRCAFLTRCKSYFNVGKWTYSFNTCLVIKNKDIYSNLFFIMNDIIFKIEQSYISFGILSSELKIFYIIIKDLNIFSEKKTNLGLFSLKNNLDLKLFLTGYDLIASKILLRSMKFNMF